MSRAAVGLALLFAGCSYTFDGSAQDFPLLGAPPGTASLPRLNHSPAGQVRVMYGRDQTTWATFRELVDGQKVLRLVHLAPPFEESLVTAQKYFTTRDSFYVFDQDPPGAADPKLRLSIFAVGATTPDGTWTFPAKPYLCSPDNFGHRFFYYVLAPETTSYAVIHRDNSFTRTLPVPDGVDPADPTTKGSFTFNSDGSLLFVSDAMDHLLVHATDDLHDWDLGKRPPVFLYDDGKRQLITCGADGLRVVPLDGGADLVLDPATCDGGGRLFFHSNGLVYTVGGELRFVTRDGLGAPGKLLDPGLRFLQFAPSGELVYSTTAADAFTNGAGDGWLGGWRFMERGRSSGFSRDGQRMRWLEHAAQDSGVGELRSAPLGGPSLLEARNVRQFSELADGRVLASTNHAFRGTQNRVVLVDEAARTQRWVADAAADYVIIPGTQDLLIDVVSGPSTYDIVRVPIPPKM